MFCQMGALNQLSADLTRARELISDPEKWCKYTLQTDDGRLCTIGSVHMAISGCCSNVWNVTDPNWPRVKAACDLLDGISQERGYSSACTHNNDVEHGGVMSLFDTAIARAKEQENAV